MRYVLVSCLFILSSCLPVDPFPDNGENMAYVPVYGPANNDEDVALLDPRPIIRPGKIYVYRQYIFQNEEFEGVHVIDNSNPAHPVKKSFLSIPYNTDLAIRGDHLYANSINDLLVIDVSEPLHPKMVSRTKDAFPMIDQNYPPDWGFFVCPDPAKGVVVGWKLEPVNNPGCRR